MLKMSNNLAENLFIITAPSGAGKTTLIKNVIEFAQINDEKVFMSVSHTTRTPRSNELDGTDYSFISEEEFKSKIKGVINPYQINNTSENIVRIIKEINLAGITKKKFFDL